MTSMDDFLIRAFVAGVGVAAVAGPLGSLVVWRRMAFFGGALAHSALLGIALGLVLGVDLYAGVIAVCVAFALSMALLQRQREYSADTLLGIVSHAALAFGLVVVSFLETVRVDLMAYLFGDPLAVAPADLVWVYGGGAVALGALAVLWRPLLALTVHEELARAEGVKAGPVQLAFMLIVAFTVAIAMKVVGILLVTSLLIIPAATARRLSRTPEQMAVLAALTGVLAVAGGLLGSLRFDVPTGPMIVVVATALFAATAAVPLVKSWHGAVGAVLLAVAMAETSPLP
jgi:zinc transport system permease protein